MACQCRLAGRALASIVLMHPWTIVKPGATTCDSFVMTNKRRNTKLTSNSENEKVAC